MLINDGMYLQLKYTLVFYFEIIIKLLNLLANADPIYLHIIMKGGRMVTPHDQYCGQT